MLAVTVQSILSRHLLDTDKAFLRSHRALVNHFKCDDAWCEDAPLKGSLNHEAHMLQSTTNHEDLSVNNRVCSYCQDTLYFAWALVAARFHMSFAEY
jgi:hypothetical protein